MAVAASRVLPQWTNALFKSLQIIIINRSNRVNLLQASIAPTRTQTNHGKCLHAVQSCCVHINLMHAHVVMMWLIGTDRAACHCSPRPWLIIWLCPHCINSCVSLSNFKSGKKARKTLSQHSTEDKQLRKRLHCNDDPDESAPVQVVTPRQRAANVDRVGPIFYQQPNVQQQLLSMYSKSKERKNFLQYNIGHHDTVLNVGTTCPMLILFHYIANVEEEERTGKAEESLYV